MTVSPSDIPEYEPPDNDTAVEISPFSFLPPGGFGDFRPVSVPATADDEPDPYTEELDPKD